MTQYLYLISILFSMAGMVIVDKKYKLAWFYNSKKTLVTILAGVVIFILWDIIGISMGIFFSGQSKYMSGLYLGPEFPVEELLFLTFLCYFTLIVYRLGETQWHRFKEPR